MEKVSGGLDLRWRRKPEVGFSDFGQVEGNPTVEFGPTNASTW